MAHLRIVFLVLIINWLSMAQSCFFTQWGSWGPCSTSCGGGVRKRINYCHCISSWYPCTEGTISEISGCNQFCLNGGNFSGKCTCTGHTYGTCCAQECPGVQNCKITQCTQPSNNKCIACNDEYREVKGICEAVCSPHCMNGGTCVRPGECKCTVGYYGNFCELAICEPECENNGTCVSPGTCDCSYGYFGKRCELGGNVDEYLKPKKVMTNSNEGSHDSWYEFSEWYPYGKVCFVKIKIKGAEKETLIVANSVSTTNPSHSSYGNYTVAPTDETFSINSTKRAACLEFRCPNDDETVLVEISTMTKSKVCRAEFHEASGSEVNAANGTFSFKVKSDIDYGPFYGIYKGFGTRRHATYSASALCYAGNNQGSDVMIPEEGNIFSYFCS